KKNSMLSDDFLMRQSRVVRGLEHLVGMGQRMRKRDEIVTLHQTLKVGGSMKNMWTHYVHQWKNQMLKMEILKT
ncbi:TPA: hypothetical protein ACXOPY_004544, partial [Citrobacter freundii]